MGYILATLIMVTILWCAYLLVRCPAPVPDTEFREFYRKVVSYVDMSEVSEAEIRELVDHRPFDLGYTDSALETACLAMLWARRGPKVRADGYTYYPPAGK